MGKSFEKQIKTIDNQGQKQVDALKDLKPKEQTQSIEDKWSVKSYNYIQCSFFNY